MTNNPSQKMRSTPVGEAFERTGIRVPELAKAVGIGEASCFDLLEHEDELTSCLTLRQVSRLAGVLRVPVVMLLEDPPAPAKARRSFGDLAEAILQFCEAQKLTVEQFGDDANWDVQPFLKAPDSALDGWCLDTLMEVCEALDLHWPDYLPDAAKAG